MSLPRLYSAKELAQYFGNHERTVRNWINAGLLPRVPGLKKLRVTEDAVAAFVNGKSANGR